MAPLPLGGRGANFQVTTGVSAAVTTCRSLRTFCSYDGLRFSGSTCVSLGRKKTGPGARLALDLHLALEALLRQLKLIPGHPYKLQAIYFKG